MSRCQRHRNESTFPARDEGMAAIIRGMSEPTRARHADNLMSNEDSYPRVSGELSRRVRPGGVFVGVGPDQNFSFVAHCRPALAFVIDHRRANLLLHMLHRALFCLAADRARYLSLFTARAFAAWTRAPSAADLVAAFQRAQFEKARLDATQREIRRVLEPLKIIRESEWAELARMQRAARGAGDECTLPGVANVSDLGSAVTTASRAGGPAHFLATEPFYQVVRERQIGERIVPLVGDFAGDHTFKALGEWLRHRGLKVDVLYISDVEFFLLRSKTFDAYIANLHKLPLSDQAIIIRTSTRSIVHAERVQGDSSTTVAREPRAVPRRGRARVGFERMRISSKRINLESDAHAIRPGIAFPSLNLTGRPVTGAICSFRGSRPTAVSAVA